MSLTHAFGYFVKLRLILIETTFDIETLSVRLLPKRSNATLTLTPLTPVEQRLY